MTTFKQRSAARLIGIAAAGLAGLALPGGPASGQDAGRYQLQRTDDGFVRLDSATGSVSHCRRVNAVWTCHSLDKERDALIKRVDRLAAENRQLHKRIAALEKSLRTRSDTKRDGLELPSDEEFEQIMGFFEKTMRRFMEFARTLREPQDKDI